MRSRGVLLSTVYDQRPYCSLPSCSFINHHYKQYSAREMPSFSPKNETLIKLPTQTSHASSPLYTVHTAGLRQPTGSQHRKTQRSKLSNKHKQCAWWAQSWWLRAQFSGTDHLRDQWQLVPTKIIVHPHFTRFSKSIWEKSVLTIIIINTEYAMRLFHCLHYLRH